MSLLAKGKMAYLEHLLLKQVLKFIFAYLLGLNSPILYVCLQLDLQFSFENLIK